MASPEAMGFFLQGPVQHQDESTGCSWLIFTPKSLGLSTSHLGSPMGPISQDLLCLSGPSAFFPVGHS